MAKLKTRRTRRVKRKTVAKDAVVDRSGFIALTLHDRIRKALDPECAWMTDQELQRILRVAFGLQDRAIHKCLLLMQRKGYERQDASLVTEARRLTFAFETGQFTL